VEEVENMFWKNLAFSPPLYGADIKISLMDNETQWNYNNLNSVLKEGLLKRISGVNEPYLYIGTGIFRLFYKLRFLEDVFRLA
jgi:jumonji domain-containing protein 2